MSRLRNLVLAMLALFAMEIVRVGLIGLAPLFSSGFEFAMSAFVAAWIADGVESQSNSAALSAQDGKGERG